MKNLLTTCLVLSAPALAASETQRELPTVELQPLESKFEPRQLPSFDGVAFGPAAEAETLAGRLLEAAGAQEPLGLVKFSVSPDGSKLRFQGALHTSTCLVITPRTGDISFQTDVEGMDLEQDTPGLPTGADAVDRALQHLAATDLLPANQSELFVQHVGGIRMGALDESGETTEYTKLTSVHFGRRIAGIPVGGPGSKIIVHLGEYGRLVGVTRRWTELEVRVHAPEELLGAAEVPVRVASDLQSTFCSAERIRGRQPALGFYDDGKGRIEPAWFTEAELTYEGEAQFALSIVPALRTSTADFLQGETPYRAPVDAAEAAATQDSGQDD